MIDNKDKIILDLCGGTGAWSKPYKDNGYTVYNITLPQYDVTICNFINNQLIFGNYNHELFINIKDIYGILAAPPCTQFSFARTIAEIPRNLKKGMKIVIDCLNIIWQCQYEIKKDTQRKSSLKFWALENPKAMLEWFLGKPAFVFNPYEFGDLIKKKTALWGCFNNPTKQLFFEIDRRKFERLPINKLREIKKEYNYLKLDRKALRSITPAGFAKAFYEANK